MANEYCTYITVHEPTGLFYIGKALLSNIERGYKGSGVKLRLAFKQYPKSQWKCGILWEFETSDEAYSDEAGIVTNELLRDPLCLNSSRGGGKNMGGRVATEEQREKLKAVHAIAQATPSARKAHSEATKRWYDQNPEARAKTAATTKLQWIRWREARGKA